MIEKLPDNGLLLSIESSCDDSSLALTDIDSKKLILHKKISQEIEHSHYGGVVPELASRLHAVALPKLLESTLSYMKDITAVAVTTGPGLSVTLNEGVMMAKTVAKLQNIPAIGVHHLKGHIYSLFIEKDTKFPMLSIVISGGHTMVVKVKNINSMEILATTMDDSVGESFDKVAKMMGLGYPGGPIIEALASKGDASRFPMPVPLRNSPLIAFSLSGLKNAVRLTIEKLGGKEQLTEQDMHDIAASFQKAVIEHLIQKIKKIVANEKEIKDVSIVGGAGANLAIREAFENLCNQYGKRLHTVKLEYCSDNAAMIGRCAIDMLKYPTEDIFNLKVTPSKKLSSGMKL